MYFPSIYVFSVIILSILPNTKHSDTSIVFEYFVFKYIEESIY